MITSQRHNPANHAGLGVWTTYTSTQAGLHTNGGRWTERQTDGQMVTDDEELIPALECFCRGQQVRNNCSPCKVWTLIIASLRQTQWTVLI